LGSFFGLFGTCADDDDDDDAFFYLSVLPIFGVFFPRCPLVQWEFPIGVGTTVFLVFWFSVGRFVVIFGLGLDGIGHSIYG
jgi:hypothetical protein